MSPWPNRRPLAITRPVQVPPPNSIRNMRAGRTMAIYWRGGDHVQSDAGGDHRGDEVADRSGPAYRRLGQSPEKPCVLEHSQTQGVRINQTVLSMASMPPRDNRRSISGWPVLET